MTVSCFHVAPCYRGLLARVKSVSGMIVLAGMLAVSLSQPAATGAPIGLSYDDFAKVLNAYIDDRGRVDYQALKANRTVLDRFAACRIPSRFPNV